MSEGTNQQSVDEQDLIGMFNTKQSKTLKKITFIAVILLIIAVGLSYILIIDQARYLHNQLPINVMIASSKRVNKSLPTKIDVLFLGLNFEFPIEYYFEGEKISPRNLLDYFEVDSSENDVKFETLSILRKTKIRSELYDEIVKVNVNQIDHKMSFEIGDINEVKDIKVSLYDDDDDVAKSFSITENLLPIKEKMFAKKISTEFPNEFEGVVVDYYNNLANAHKMDITSICLDNGTLLEKEAFYEASEFVVKNKLYQINGLVTGPELQLFGKVNITFSSQSDDNRVYNIISKYSLEVRNCVSLDDEGIKLYLINNNHSIVKEIPVEVADIIDMRTVDLSFNTVNDGIHVGRNSIVYKNPVVDVTYEYVESVILDQDADDLDEAELLAIKKGIELIPLNLWSDAVNNPLFNVLVYSTEQDIRDALEESINVSVANGWDIEPIEYYLNEVFGLAFHDSQDINNNKIALLKYTMDKYFNPSDYVFDGGYYFHNKIDSSYESIQISDYNQHRDHELSWYTKVFLHEMGHYFDFDKLDSISDERYTYSTKVPHYTYEKAKKLYKNDHYYSRSEFFAESFAQYLLNPESLKNRSSETHYYMKNLVYDFKGEYDQYIEIYKQINSDL